MKRIKLDLSGKYEDENTEVQRIVSHDEASDYKGCYYELGKTRVIQRTAKVTPKKIGQFVTLWKRNSAGETCPMSEEDNFDYVIILCRANELSGRFVFPKRVLLEKGYISSTEIPGSGKRGFRVYPNWDQPKSKQAVKTQLWQSKYFKKTLLLEESELI
jgi:hypothetical protein